MENEQRRRTAVVVALIAAVAAAVLLTLRCAATTDGDRRDDVARGDKSGDGAHASRSARATSERPSGGRDPSSASKSPRAPRSRTETAAEPAAAEPATDTSAATDPALPKPATADSPWLEGVKPAARGRFALVGAPDWSVSGYFGASVAVDGDIAVIAAPGAMSRGWVVCGEAYIYERREHVWTPTAVLKSPRPDVEGFARRVAVSGTRIAVFGGFARGSEAPVFNTYVRGKDGSWSEEAEVPTGEPMSWDATLRGDVAFVGEKTAVGVYRFESGKWSRVQSLAAPADRAQARFGVGLSSAGEALAVHCDDVTGPNGVGTEAYIYRLRAGAFVEETRLSFEGQRLFGCLARAGAALVSMGERGPLIVSEREASDWGRALIATKDWGAMHTSDAGHPFAADGNLVVGASGGWREFVVLERRADGWYRTAIVPAADVVQGAMAASTMWPPQEPCVALSGRTAVVGTGQHIQGDGRLWFFDITDEDLARATKVESDAK